MNKRKKKLKPLADRKKDEFGKYWLTKCNTLTGHIWHTYYTTGKCCVNNEDCKYFHGHPEMHHLIGKAHYLYTWDVPNNMIDICHYHHDRMSKFSPHSTPELFLAWLSKEYPEKWEYIQNNKGTITRKHDLPFTFKEKYYELLELENEREVDCNP